MKREAGAFTGDDDDDAPLLRQKMNFSPVAPSCWRASWRFDRCRIRVLWDIDDSAGIGWF